jgi:hypothetical protein
MRTCKYMIQRYWLLKQLVHIVTILRQRVSVTVRLLYSLEYVLSLFNILLSLLLQQILSSTSPTGPNAAGYNMYVFVLPRFGLCSVKLNFVNSKITLDADAPIYTHTNDTGKGKLKKRFETRDKLKMWY